MRNISTIVISLLLCTFFYGCTSDTDDAAAKKHVTVHDLLSINEESSGSPLFAFVYDAVSDSQGNMYLVDPSTQNIHSYNSAGSYRWSIGGSGQGPGEFRLISSIHMDDDDRLFVYDSERAIITIFDNDGDIIDNWSFDFGRKTIENIRQAHNNVVLLPFWDEGKLIHLYSFESGEIEASLVDFREVLQTEDEIEEELFQSNPGSAISLNESHIVYVPGHYAGVLYVFEKTTGDVWQIKETIKGYRQFDPSITFHVSQDGSYDRSHMSGYNPRGGGSYVHYEFHSMSFGLYTRGDGTVVHLSYQAADDEMHLVVENFDMASNRLQSYSIIEDLGIQFRPDKWPVWMDPNGRIYLADNSALPELRVLRLDYE